MRAPLPAVRPILAAGGPHLPALLERVEERLAHVAVGHGPTLGEHAAATIAAGGKRLRPLLVLLAAGPPADDGEDLVRAAVAVELVHSATLVHDDVLDRADLRRGRPTVWALAGRGMAVAVGDLLFSRAFAELALTGSLAAVRALSVASSALAEGELLQREDAWDGEVGIERYLRRCELKTAALFGAAGELGALQRGAPPEPLGAFGRLVGLAFQVLDDVLDVSGPPERTGKPRGADLLDGTVTLPFILARERDPALRRLDVRALEGPRAAAGVCERIAATGALDDARERALELVRCAKAGLGGAVLDEDQRRALELVADSVVSRSS
ncbi:MAG: polyprenyl synthetase family protein [Actinomycetota bacterium]|nr:polyprenyl synthetase family protein [Actinomycetota bacterium]